MKTKKLNVSQLQKIEGGTGIIGVIVPIIISLINKNPDSKQEADNAHEREKLMFVKHPIYIK